MTRNGRPKVYKDEDRPKVRSLRVSDNRMAIIRQRFDTLAAFFEHAFVNLIDEKLRRDDDQASSE